MKFLSYFSILDELYQAERRSEEKLCKVVITINHFSLHATSYEESNTCGNTYIKMGCTMFRIDLHQLYCGCAKSTGNNEARLSKGSQLMAPTWFQTPVK